MNNPFETIDKRLSNIESLLIDIKHKTIPGLVSEFVVANKASDYLSRKQASDLLQVDLSTLHNWVVKGVLIQYAMGGRRYFKRSEIELKLKEDNDGK